MSRKALGAAQQARHDQEDAMSHNPLIPPKPAAITLDTLPELFAHHRARFGGWSMTSGAPENEPPAGGDNPPPERPEGISETEWNALGDPGRTALTREREARQEAERALAAARARPAPPKGGDPPKPPKQDDPPKGGDQQQNQQLDVAKIVEQAVAAAVKPFTDREEQRAVGEAAEKVQNAVVEAAKGKLHDPSDALLNIDLTTVVDEHGRADAAKVTAELDGLLKRKPHLAKVGTERVAPPGIGGGAPAGSTEGEKVKAALAAMQAATGVRPSAEATSTTQ